MTQAELKETQCDLETTQARVENLRRQLQTRNAREEDVKELVKYVKQQRDLERYRAHREQIGQHH